MHSAPRDDADEAKDLPDLESGSATQPPGPRLAGSSRYAVAGDEEVVVATATGSEQEGEPPGEEGEPAAKKKAPLPIRICCRLCELVFKLLLITIMVCVGIVCLPVFCCCFMVHYRAQGRTVTLDGTQPPNLDDEARDRIDSLKSDAFAPRVEEFRANVSRTFTRTMSRSATKQVGPELPNNNVIDMSVTASNTVATLNNNNSSNAPPALSQVANDAGERRELLKQARIVVCKNASQSIPGHLIITVEREHALQQSLACLGAAKCIDLMAKNLHVRFKGEKGVDAGGLTRDWFDILGRGLMVAAENGGGHLMLLPDKTLAPRPYDTRFTDLYATGRLIGLALWFGIPLPIPLGSVTCKFMLDVPISPVDLQRLDPDFVQFRVKPVLRPGGVLELEAALGEPLTFMSAATDLRAAKELCPGGEEKQVTEENKHEYLKLLCEHHLCGDMQEQIKVLLEGFWEIFPKDMLTCSGITHRELALLVSGYPDLDPEDWRKNTRMNSSDCDEVMSWFWAMVAEMSTEDRAKLLHFATGSSRLPVSGFSGIAPKFNISVQGDDTEHLPHAHTCGNQLVIPRYTSKEQLVEKMQIALSNDEGFGFA